MINIVRDTFLTKYLLYLIVLFFLCNCGSKPHGDVAVSDLAPKLEPDYSEVTIPPNIAPLNFIIKENGSAYFVKFSSVTGTEIEVYSRKGEIRIPQKKWRKMLQNNTGKEFKVDIFSKDKQGKWLKFKTITNKVAPEPIDPYLYYRLLYPGYESWAELSINRRNLENFKAQSLIENSVVDENCINCHSFNNGKTDDFLFHMRGTMGGTYFYSGGEFSKINLKTKEMKNGAVYPRWHPSGKFVAFSSNKIIQRFHAADNKKVEVSDLESSLVLYDVEKNEIMNIELANKDKFMDTYPEWSPDGRYLYFCSAKKQSMNKYNEIRYDLMRIAFDPENCSFGELDTVCSVSDQGKSVSFPRISPDGKYLLFCMSDYGNFSIWHPESDLYLLDLTTGKTSFPEINSNSSESFHTWSSTGRWIVFSSRRGDGLYTRSYFSYFDSSGRAHKPFVLPQRNPGFYTNFLKSFNLPELVTTRVELNPRKLTKVSASVPVNAVFKSSDK